MATMEEKKLRQLSLFNTVIAGFAEGLYDLFGESAAATMDAIGHEINQEMIHELGLEISEEPPQDILTEIERVLIDEYGLATNAKMTIDEGTHEIHIMCENCLLRKSCKDLVEAGVPTYSCVPTAMITGAMHARFGKRFKPTNFDHDFEERICKITGKLLD